MCFVQERQLSFYPVCTFLSFCPRFTFWLTFFQSYVTFILQWIAFIFGRNEEEDQQACLLQILYVFFSPDVRGLPFVLTFFKVICYVYSLVD